MSASSAVEPSLLTRDVDLMLERVAAVLFFILAPLPRQLS